MMKQANRRAPENQREQRRLFTLWILRAFSDKNHRELLFEKGDDLSYEDREVAYFLKLPEAQTQFRHCEDMSSLRAQNRAQKMEVFKIMESKLQQLEAEPSRNCFSSTGKKNFDTLSNFLKLNATERAVLEFFVSATVAMVFTDTFSILRKECTKNLSNFLSRVLKIPLSRIHKVLQSNSRLVDSGILLPARYGYGDVEPALRFFSDVIANEMFVGPINEQSVVNHIVTPAPPSALTISDFPHLDPILSLLIPYLRKAIRSRKKGVNVFIHGHPGTGKSELARLLSSLTSTHAYEVPTETMEGNPSEKRIQSLKAATTFIQPNNNLLIFDEAEDIFSSHSFFSPSVAQANKGWINRLLENNRVPIIWISNDVDCLDNAFTRRFDFIFEVPVAPRVQRSKTIRKILGKTYSESFVQHLSHSEHISPAVISRAGSVISGLVPGNDKTRRESAVSLLVSNTLKAQGHPEPFRHAIDPINPATYDISNLNSSGDLERIARALASEKSARICLYGPPGTGKTSFGHWLANELALPLHCKKASDLLAPYLGETEKNMARAFEAARQEQAILLIDEVDSFLRDRTLANRSWEISQVNEFLTQMESFPGIFIASTNLKENLDPASLRRFDLKLLFDFLLPEQSLRLLHSHSHALNLTPPTEEDIRSLQHLLNSTPGDFGNVARQCRFQNQKTASRFLELLIQECEMKTITSSRKIGFLG